MFQCTVHMYRDGRKPKLMCLVLQASEWVVFIYLSNRSENNPHDSSSLCTVIQHATQLFEPRLLRWVDLLETFQLAHAMKKRSMGWEFQSQAYVSCLSIYSFSAKYWFENMYTSSGRLNKLGMFPVYWLNLFLSLFHSECVCVCII